MPKRHKKLSKTKEKKGKSHTDPSQKIIKMATEVRKIGSQCSQEQKQNQTKDFLRRIQSR
jgi:hypothetical protein